MRSTVLWSGACILLAALTAACGHSPSSPTSSADGPAELRIVGLTGPLTPGATTQLKADLVLASGTARTCPVALRWSSDNPSITTVSSSGVLTAVAAGYANVTASCGAVTASVEAKVEAPNPRKWDVAVRDADWGAVVRGVTLEFLDGPRKGERVRFDIETRVAMPAWPVRARFTADDYLPLEFVFSEASAALVSHYSLFWIRMVFAPQPGTDTYANSLTGSVPAASHSFTVRTPGDVRIRSWWDCATDIGYATVELWCNGTELRRERAPYRGGEIVQAVGAPGACEVRMNQWPTETRTQYRVAITYPH